MNSIENKKTSNGKIFLVRNSLLTDLLENKHLQSVYNIFLAILIGFLINTTVAEYIKDEKLSFGLKLIKIGFGKFHVVILTWFSLFLLHCSTFFLFKVWARNRNFNNLRFSKIWDWSWMILFLLYYICGFQLVHYYVTFFKLPIGSAAIISIDQCRLLMKSHAFVRTNVPKVKQHKIHDDGDLILPTFSHFLYFSFAPTLIYRDNYPRKETINWGFVLYRLLELIGTIFFLSFVGERFLNPSVQDFGIRKYTVKEIILKIFENSITGMFIKLGHFFVVLHAVQNLFAEITRFGDRMFYSDWWTATDYNTYLRKWNIVVQEWLNVYIYKDLLECFGTSKMTAKYVMILVSALAHEWCLICILDFFFPLLSLEFIVLGTILSLCGGYKNVFFNALLWYCLSLGMGSIVTLYGIEYYARANVPITDVSLKNTLLPRFLTCNCIE